MSQRRSTRPGPGFQPLPPPGGEPPYHVTLPAGEKLVFHSAGDTGGWEDPEPQRRVIDVMASRRADFLLHLGDVVYPHGEAAHYREQFDDAYAGYDAAIYAVPGNHDAESGHGLDPFRAHFAAQPHVHFTLVHELIRIIGLWANVPEGGQFDAAQVDWLIGELRDAPARTPVVLAVHQPVYSADVTHGGNLDFADLLDDCAARAGRGPDAVFSGHAHVYERFMRGRVPYVVAGAGGFHQLHRLARGVRGLPARFDGAPGVTLEAVVDDAHGFLTVTAAASSPGRAEAFYTAVDEVGAAVADRFTFGPA